MANAEGVAGASTLMSGVSAKPASSPSSPQPSKSSSARAGLQAEKRNEKATDDSTHGQEALFESSVVLKQVLGDIIGMISLDFVEGDDGGRLDLSRTHGSGADLSRHPRPTIFLTLHQI